MHNQVISYFLSAFLLLFCFQLQSQEIVEFPNWHFLDRSIIPDPSPEMPAFARLLYADQVDMKQLDEQVRAYGKTLQLEKDPFAKFYWHWFKGAQEFVDEQGIVRVMDTAELLEFRATQQLTQTGGGHAIKKAAGPESSWSFVGPRETLWRADHNENQAVAPWQVNLYCLTPAPSNPATLFCGSETGELYKTTDKGLNWTPVMDYNWGGAPLSIAIDPENENIIYVGANSDIFKSIDGGANWEIIFTNSGMSCNALAISPNDANLILAGGSNGLFKSTDAGNNWEEIFYQIVNDIKFKPGDGTTVNVLLERGQPDTYRLMHSSDSAETFVEVETGWPALLEASGGRMATSEADPNVLLALLLTNGYDNSASLPYLLKSADAGLSWEILAECDNAICPLNNGQGYYDLDVELSQTDPEQIIIATTTAYRSQDGGLTWTTLGGYSGPFGIHPDIQEIVSIRNGDSEDTWIATDGGLNFSTDFYAAVENWEPRISGLDGTDFWGYAQGWNEDFMIGGRYHNGNTALHENYPDQMALRLGGAESVTGWALHGRERYAAFDDISELILPAEIDQAPEGSFLFTKHPQNYYYGDAFSRVMTDLEDYMCLYLGEGNNFWRSKDGGARWESIFTFDGLPYHFDISRANPNVIYLTTDQGLYRSNNRGEAFNLINLPPGMTNWNAQNFRLAASSIDENEVWVLDHRTGSNSQAGRVFKSVDGGENWIDWTTEELMGKRWTAIAHQAGTNGGVYIASDRGSAGSNSAQVLYRDNSMEEWQDFSEGLPASARPIKILPFYRDEKLRWAGNRGVWEVDFYETDWTPICRPFVSGRQQVCIRDTVHFDSYAVAKGDATYTWAIPNALWTSDLNQREVAALFPEPGDYSAILYLEQDGDTYPEVVQVEVSSECNADAFPGNALSLSGETTDYAASLEAFDVTIQEATYSAWIKRNGDQNDWAGIVFMRSNSAHGLNFGTDNELRYHWGNNQWQWNSNHIVPDNEWVHVALVITETEGIIYMNGVPSINATPSALAVLDNPVFLGSDPNWADRRFNGEMDEVLIYDRALSQEEIREQMHLTRIPESEEGLMAYWQFNRDEGMITDRNGTRHAGLVGGASRITSSAPVGPGQSMRLDVNGPGTYDFAAAELAMTFSENATAFPDGEICVSRLEINPDALPAVYNGLSYWIIHNYGENQSFDELIELNFDEVGEFPSATEADPSDIILYKRGISQEGDTWQEVDFADEVELGQGSNAIFAAGNNQSSFGQYIVGCACNLFSHTASNEGLNFNAWLKEDKVQLQWTENENKAIASFEIERATQNMEFESFVQLAATDDIIHEYLDSHPIQGISFYRLLVHYEDGSQVRTANKKIVYNAFAEAFLLYPNPLKVGEVLQLRSNTNEAFLLKIYDAKGRMVLERAINGSGRLYLDGLAAGTYSYSISSQTSLKNGLIHVI